MKKLYLTPIERQMPYWNGRFMYHFDFEKCILPKLKENFEIVFNPDEADVIFCPSVNIERDYISHAKVVVNLHGRMGDERCKGHLLTFPRNWEFIVQLKSIKNDYGHLRKIHYIPMGIDLDRLPKNIVQVYDMIYYGNIVNEAKKEVIKKLRKKYTFDVLSFGHLNDSKMTFSNKQCLDIVSRYKVGIGVGICATEMLCMGMKVIVAGEKYGGCVNFGNLTQHKESNFNGTYSDDSERLNKISAKFFDRKNFAHRFIEILNAD